MSKKYSKLPLRGVRIIDFTWILAGPLATRILADFGAEVIKIQSKIISTGTERYNSYYYACLNRNKLGCTLNMSRSEARNLLFELIKISDVIIQNFTPRVMENWGFTYEYIKRLNPSIIMANLSGMGMTGPWKNYAALSHTIEALSGISYLSSYNKHQPILLGYPHADIASGLFTALSILAAIEQREHTGKGICLDISEFEIACSLLGPALLEYSINKKIPSPYGDESDCTGSTIYGCYRCAGDDKWCVIIIVNKDQWKKFCRLMGDPPWTKSTKFSTAQKRKKYKRELDKYIENWTTKHKPEQLKKILGREKIMCALVNNVQNLLNDRQLQKRNFICEIPHPMLEKIKSVSNPIKLSRTPFSIQKPAPNIGQDNYYVFKNLLKLSDRLIKEYINKGIIS